MRVFVLSVALALALSALLAKPAAAAMCFDFTLRPASPQVGEATTIEVRSEWPAGLSDLAVRVWAPDRSTAVVALTQLGTEENWRGTLVFDRPGTWALQAEVAVPSNEYPCFYQTVEVEPVEPSVANSGDPKAMVLASALVLAAAVLIHQLGIRWPSRIRTAKAGKLG